MQNRVSLWVWLALSLVCTFCRSASAAVPNDFDGDGVSDLTRVEVGSDDALTWKAVLSASGSTTTLGTLGKKGDHLAMAQWFGSGTQIGIVSESATDDSIVWTVINPSGVQVEFTLGTKGDLVVAGADFNGNGIADAAVVRLVDGKATWVIRLDPLVFSSNEASEVVFGKSGDRAFFARVDSSASDWIGVIGKGSGGRSLARMRNLVTGEVRRFTRLPKLASQGSRPRAFPIRQVSGPDLLGFQVASGSSTRITVASFSGARIYSSSFVGTGVSVVGDFNAGPGFEIVYQSSDESVVANPTSGEEREAVFLDGIAVDEVNLNVLGQGSTGGGASGGSGGGGSGDSGSGGSSGGSVSQCSSIVPWPNGHIYKTIGSEHFFDVRRNTIGIVVRPGGRGPFPSCVQALDTSGNVVAQLGLYARGAGWEARYYAGVGCGSGTPFNGASVAGKARANTGSPRVYMNFGGVCYGPIDAGVCIGSKQC
ncbi:MAG: hypothetical protein ACK5GN_08420 [Pseudomonadota bacterium]|jgi:hypothetical protein